VERAHVTKAVSIASTNLLHEALVETPEGVRVVTLHIPDRGPEVMEATLLAQERVAVAVAVRQVHTMLNPDFPPPPVPFRVLVTFMAVVQTAAGLAKQGMLEIPETPAMRQLLLQLIV
jgi:hypothetical protein